MRKYFDSLLLRFQVAIGYRKMFVLKDKTVYLTKKEIAAVLVREKIRREATRQIVNQPKRKKKFGY